MCKWARWRIDEIRVHKIVRKKILVKMNWMKRAERISGGGSEEKLNTIKWKKPANSIDLDQFPLIFLHLPFVDMYFICAVAFISNQSNEQVQSAKKQPPHTKFSSYFRLWVFVAFYFNICPIPPIYIDTHRHVYMNRAHTSASECAFCLFVYLVHSFIRLSDRPKSKDLVTRLECK